MHTIRGHLREGSFSLPFSLAQPSCCLRCHFCQGCLHCCLFIWLPSCTQVCWLVGGLPGWLPACLIPTSNSSFLSVDLTRWMLDNYWFWLSASWNLYCQHTLHIYVHIYIYIFIQVHNFHFCSLRINTPPDNKNYLRCLLLGGLVLGEEIKLKPLIRKKLKISDDPHNKHPGLN